MDGHPDDLTTMEEFRVLLEERPADAEFELRRGMVAVAVIEELWQRVYEASGTMTRLAMTSALGPSVPESTNQVAANYGMLWQQHVVLSEIVNIMAGAIGPLVCPHGNFHGGIEPPPEPE